MTRPLTVSVIVSTYNRIATLPATLRALQSLRWPHVEVVVVNGPSDDGTDTHLELFWKDRIKLVSCPVANLSVSRNIGIRAAAGDILAFIDDDGVPEPDWLDRLLPAYDDPEIAAVGGWVRDTTGFTYQSKHIACSRSSRSRSLGGTPVVGDDEWFPSLIGVNSSIRRSVAEEIGGFDEHYAYFLDETDLIVRILDAGYRIAMVEDAEVHHKYAESHVRPSDPSKQTLAATSLSKAYFVMRHGPRKHATEEQKFAAVATVEKELQQNVTWRLEAGECDAAIASRLRHEVKANVTAGVAAYYEGPRLIQGPLPLFPFKPLPSTPAAERLRLAFVNETFFPRPVGGIAVIQGELARRLAADGHEVSIITRAERGAVQSVDYEDGVWVHRLPHDAAQAEPPAGMPPMPGSQALFANQVLAEIDRVNAHRQFHAVIGSIWDLDLAAVIASGRYKVGMYLVTSYLLSLPSKPEWTQNQDFYKNHVLPMVEAEKWAMHSVDRLYSSTEAIVDDTLAHYGLAQANLPPVIRTTFGFADRLAVTTASNDNTVTLTFVGRLERRKGADLLLGVLPQLLTDFPDLRVRLAGEDLHPPGETRTCSQIFFEQHAGASWLDRVSVLGYLDDDSVQAEFEACDVFVAPSRYESFGLIYVEAMRAGKPCVGLRVGGVPEVVENGVSGLLVEPDGSGLAEALAALIGDRSRRLAMGKAARQRYEAKFTMDAYAARFTRSVREWAIAEQ